MEQDGVFAFPSLFPGIAKSVAGALFCFLRG